MSIKAGVQSPNSLEKQCPWLDYFFFSTKIFFTEYMYIVPCHLIHIKNMDFFHGQKNLFVRWFIQIQSMYSERVKPLIKYTLSMKPYINELYFIYGKNKALFYMFPLCHLKSILLLFHVWHLDTLALPGS